MVFGDAGSASAAETFDNRDVIQIRGVDLKQGVDRIVFNLQVPEQNGQKRIQIRAGSADGTFLGSVTPTRTAAGTSANFEARLVGSVEGVQDLFFIAAGGNNVAQINQITLSGDAIKNNTGSAGAERTPEAPIVDSDLPTPGDPGPRTGGLDQGPSPDPVPAPDPGPDPEPPTSPAEPGPGSGSGSDDEPVVPTQPGTPSNPDAPVADVDNGSPKLDAAALTGSGRLNDAAAGGSVGTEGATITGIEVDDVLFFDAFDLGEASYESIDITFDGTPTTGSDTATLFDLNQIDGSTRTLLVDVFDSDFGAGSTATVPLSTPLTGVNDLELLAVSDLPPLTSIRFNPAEA